MNSENIKENLVKVQSWEDLFKMIMEKSMANTHVSTLAIFNEVVQEYDSEKKYGIISCKPIPLIENQTEYILNAYFITNRTFTENEIVCILYMDYDFRNSLSYDYQTSTQNPDNHSLNFGIVITQNNNGGGNSSGSGSDIGNSNGNIELGSTNVYQYTSTESLNVLNLDYYYFLTNYQEKHRCYFSHYLLNGENTINMYPGSQAYSWISFKIAGLKSNQNYTVAFFSSNNMSDKAAHWRFSNTTYSDIDSMIWNETCVVEASEGKKLVKFNVTTNNDGCFCLACYVRPTDVIGKGSCFMYYDTLRILECADKTVTYDNVPNKPLYMYDMQPKAIWKNANPNSSFHGDVWLPTDINQNTSDIRYVIVEFKNYANELRQTEFRTFHIPDANYNEFFLTAMDNTKHFSRRIVFTDVNLYIDRGYENGETNDYALIPVAVYGTTFIH